MNEMIEIKTSIMADLAIETWRLAKLNPQKSKERIVVSKFLKHINILFEEYDIKVIDFTDQRYDPGMSVEIIHTDNSELSSPSEEIISETIRPSVLVNGNLFRHGQVITKKIAYGGKQDDSDQKQQG
jgi:hypothetical protein